MSFTSTQTHIQLHMLTHSFAALVKFISWFFRLSSSGTLTGNPPVRSEWEYFFDRGPRILIVHPNGTYHLTGLFSVKMVYKDGKLSSCRPTIFTRKPKDKLFIGQKAYDEFSKLRKVAPSGGLEVWC